MNVKDLLPDARTNNIERINGVYQFRSDVFLDEVLQKILTEKDAFLLLRKNGLLISGVLRLEGVSSTNAIRIIIVAQR